MDGINLLEILADFIPRCNYAASLEGLIIIRYVKNWLDRETHILPHVAYYFLLIWEIIANVIDDAIVYARAGYGLFIHWDPYDLAKIVGKIIKFVFQLYLEGVIFKKIYYSYYDN